jgi:hypothetical protein
MNNLMFQKQHQTKNKKPRLSKNVNDNTYDGQMLKSDYDFDANFGSNNPSAISMKPVLLESTIPHQKKAFIKKLSKSIPRHVGKRKSLQHDFV